MVIRLYEGFEMLLQYINLEIGCADEIFYLEVSVVYFCCLLLGGILLLFFLVNNVGNVGLRRKFVL